MSNTSASKQFRNILQKQIDDIKSAGTYKNERIITSSQSTTITVKGSQGGILNFCANNYLGLSVIMSLPTISHIIYVTFDRQFIFRTIKKSYNLAKK